MRKRRVIEMRPVHLRDRGGVTHAMRGATGACGARSVPGCTVTTADPIDCITCLARGLTSDTGMAVIPLEAGE